MSITPSFVQILPPPLIGAIPDLGESVIDAIIGIAPDPSFSDRNGFPLRAGFISGGGACPPCPPSDSRPETGMIYPRGID